MKLDTLMMRNDCRCCSVTGELPAILVHRGMDFKKVHRNEERTQSEQAGSILRLYGHKISQICELLP